MYMPNIKKMLEPGYLAPTSHAMFNVIKGICFANTNTQLNIDKSRDV